MMLRVSDVILLMTVLAAGVTCFNQADKKHILDLHNGYRREQGASNMAKLKWDPILEKKAKIWAEKCDWDHSGIGENMAFSTYLSDPMRTRLDSAMQDMYDERLEYSYPETCMRTCHYTQFVWAATQRVGCAEFVCKNGLTDKGKPFTTGEETWWFVCNYGVLGNKGGNPFKKGPACSECPGTSTCEDGLCVGDLGNPDDFGQGDGTGVISGDLHCTNVYKNCEPWASRGECRNNAKMMLRDCCLACKGGKLPSKPGNSGGNNGGNNGSPPRPTSRPVNRPVNTGPCKDTRSECAMWVGMDQCKDNPGGMFMACQKACGWCGLSKAPSSGGSSGACKDTSRNCGQWVANNQCKQNPGGMKRVCKKSCRFC